MSLPNRVAGFRFCFLGFLILSLHLVAGRLSAQNDWPESWIDDADLRAVHFVSEHLGWAVGDRGAIWHTSDGQNWERQDSPVADSLRSVHFVDAKHGWIVGGRIPDYAQHSEGFVLRTDDGGQNWTVVENKLPLLRVVQFQDTQNGIAAGDCTVTFPTGFFQTSDSGKTWRTVAIKGRTRWKSLSLEGNAGMLLDEFGIIVPFGDKRHKPSFVTAPSQPRMHDVAWISPSQAIACGDHSTLFVSQNAGQSWERLDVRLPAECSLKCIASHSETILVGGSAGVCLSPDLGRSWSRVKVDCAQVNDIQMVDSQVGYAVGALGTIVKTTDGGRSWATTRGANRRLAVLGLFTNARSIPWKFIAQAGGVRESRVRVVTLDERIQRLAASDDDRVQDAVLAVGGSNSETWSETIPLAESRLLEKLTFELHAWQPDLVVTNAVSNGSQNQALIETISESVRLSGSSAEVVIIKTAEEQPVSQRARPTELVVPLGSTVHGLVIDASAKLNVPTAPRGQSCLARRLNSREWKQPSAILASIRRDGAFHTRRQPMSASPEQHRWLQRQAQLRATIQILIERARTSDVSSAANQAQFESLVAEMDSQSAAREIYRLAQAYFVSGNLQAALTAIDELATNYADQDVANAGIRDAICWTTSPEVALALSHQESESNSTAKKAKPKDDSPAELVQTIKRPYGTLKTMPTSYLVRDMMAEKPPEVAPVKNITQPESPNRRLLDPRRWTSIADPTVMSHPSVGFGLAAHRRLTSNVGKKQIGVYQRLLRTGPTSDWKSCAVEELVALQPDRKSTKPDVECVLAQRPRLDGRLDDSTWQFTPIQLDSQLARNSQRTVSPARVWLSHDAEYLFVAIAAPFAPGCNYPTTDQRTRKRDTPLEDQDRVELFLDVNRDYSSAWHLTIDHRGWANEDLLGDATWDPRWHIDSATRKLADGTQIWVVEAAISLTELVKDKLSDEDSWAIAIRRIVPNQATQAWPNNAIERTAGLEQSGVLRFGK